MVNQSIKTLQAPCRTYTIEKAPTPGFVLTADQYEGVGPFTTTLHVSYPAGVNKIIKIVNSDPITGDSCIPTEMIQLDLTGNASISYPVTSTHVIYTIVATGTDEHDCCIDFNTTTCQYSNYVRFEVTVPPATGSLMFTSEPSGAEIFLAPTGQVPVDKGVQTTNTISGLIAGQAYDYILRKADFNDATGTATVVADITTTVHKDLIPAEGCIYFKSDPPGAEIFLDGTVDTVIDTTFVTPKVICGLFLGTHCYKLTLDGYQDKTGCITLGTGEGQRISQTLTQQVAQAGFGAAGMIIIAGLAVGAIYMTTRKPSTPSAIR